MEAGDFAQLLCDRLLALLESSEPLASSGSSIQGGRRALGAQALAMALDEARYGVGCMLGKVHGWWVGPVTVLLSALRAPVLEAMVPPGRKVAVGILTGEGRWKPCMSAQVSLLS